MNYIKEEIGKRIQAERLRLKLSQKKLGEIINITAKQISNYENGILIPPMESMLALCKVFDCELGYLLGETDYSEKTSLKTKIFKLTGLTDTALDNISYITGNDHSSMGFGHHTTEYRNVLNRLLSSPIFPRLVDAIYHLDISYKAKDDIWVSLEKRYGKELFDKAFSLYCSHIDYIHQPNAYQLEPIYYDIFASIDSAISESYELEYPIKIARYELNEIFGNMIDELYPKKVNK